jgi:hypothetical protein
MKYGNLGGWKAVRRFNRDARIASGETPYGYRVRYASTGHSRPASELRWDVVANGKRNEAQQLYKEASPFLTKSERQDIERVIQKSAELTNVSEAEFNAAMNSFFFRSFKVDGWHAKWPKLLVEDAENFLISCKALATAAKSRRTRFKKNEMLQGAFEDAIEGLFGEKGVIVPLRSQYESTAQKILHAAVQSGVISMKRGKYTAEYSDWEDIVAKRNKFREIFISEFSQLIRSLEVDLQVKGIAVSCAERSGVLTLNGKMVKFGKLAL